MHIKKISITLALALLIGTAFSKVNSFASSQTTTFYIKHNHTGSSDSYGGCYTVPHYHVHDDPSLDSECYTPHYHEHEGNENVLGGCYVQPIYHYHTGDDSQEGGCYVTKYHTHGSGCYNTGTCSVSKSLQYYTYYPGRSCGSHGSDVSYVEYHVYESHSSCGASGGQSSIVCCAYCGPGSAGNGYNHSYSILRCTTPLDTIEGYVLGCGHVEGDVDHFEPGCGLSGVLERYDLTCSKTIYDVDYFEAGCGMENAAAVNIINDGNGSTEIINLSVDIEDLSNGTVDFSNATFTWFDSEGNEIGTGDNVNVSQNGDYRIEITLNSPGIDQNSLNGNINVSNIYDPTKHPAGGNNESGNGSNSGEGNESGNGSGNGSNGNLNGENGDDGMAEPKATPTSTPTATPTPTITPAISDKGASRDRGGHGRDGNQDDGNLGNGGYENLRERMSYEDNINGASELFYDNQDEEKYDSGYSVLKETYIDNDEELTINEKKETGKIKRVLSNVSSFLKSTPGKVISISLGSALAICALFFGLIMLRKIIPVFNYDGNNVRHFIGFSLIILTNEGYEITITKSLVEASYTNRYELFMGLFMIGKDKEQDIIVNKEKRRASARLEKMMGITI